MSVSWIEWSIGHERAAACSAVKATRFAGDPNKFGSALTASARCRSWLAVIDGPLCRLGLRNPTRPLPTVLRFRRGGTDPIRMTEFSQSKPQLRWFPGLIAEPDHGQARHGRGWRVGRSGAPSARAPRCRSWRPIALTAEHAAARSRQIDHSYSDPYSGESARGGPNLIMV